MSRFPIIVYASASILCCIASKSQAQFPTNISPPARLNTNAGTDSGEDGSPHLATDGQGNWVAVWDSNENVGGTIGTDYDILTARSTDNGVTWSAPAALNTNASSDTGNDRRPSITTDGQGHWVCVWDSNETLGATIGPDLDILVARSTDNGQTWTPPGALNTNAASDAVTDGTAQVITDGHGTWIAVWESFLFGPDEDILFARSTDNGATWTFPAPVNNDAAVDIKSDFFVQITTDGKGQWIAVWERNDKPNDTEFDIQFARSADNGATWTDPAPVNTNAGTDTAEDYHTAICTDRQGNWIVVWESRDAGPPSGGPIATDHDILLARSADNGATWTAPAPLNSNAAVDTGDDSHPQITTDGRGIWVAVWESTDTLGVTIGAEGDVLVSSSTDNGATWTPPVPLNANAASDTKADAFPQIVTDNRGNWVAVWESNSVLRAAPGGGANDKDIFTARFAFPDCNNNGVGDLQDIAGGASADCDANGVPDQCQPDTDSDGVIDACDGCAHNPGKTAPGSCGCDVADRDANGNGIADCDETPACGTCGAGAATMMPLSLLSVLAVWRRPRRAP